jgi:hypothetical protein
VLPPLLPGTPIVALVCLALLAAGCDGSESETSPETRAVAVYFLRDGKLSPVRRTVEQSPAVARTALTSLLAGPTADERAAGLTTAIPQGTTVENLELTGGVATVDLGDDAPPDGEQGLRETAQIVATLTRFPTVQAVRFPNGRTWTRQRIEEQTPQILVESPLPGDAVTSPIETRGTANVFEATVSLEVRGSDGTVLLSTFTTATSGTGTRGTFAARLAVPDVEGPVTVVAFESSAKDGRPLHVVRVPVVVAR